MDANRKPQPTLLRLKWVRRVLWGNRWGQAPKPSTTATPGRALRGPHSRQVAVRLRVVAHLEAPIREAPVAV